MMLEYTDIFAGGKTRRIKAKITTEHSASSYGMPVIVLPDGGALDAQSWVLLNYHVVSVSRADAPMMERWLSNLYGMMGMSSSAASLGRKGGSSTSSAKWAASRENGRKGGRPKKVR